MTTATKDKTRDTKHHHDDDDLSAAIELNKDVERAFIESQDIAFQCTELMDSKNLLDGIKFAKGMAQLRKLLTKEVMAPVLALMNSPLGFKTDKDPSRPQWNKKKKCFEKPEPYGWEVVRDCFVASLIHGLRPTGNEWNIISGQFYCTREGFERKVNEWPGISDFMWQPDSPKILSETNALVGGLATWKIDGKEQSLEFTGDKRIPVRINAGMGADAVLGKGERKALKFVYKKLSGRSIADTVGEEPEPEVTIPEVKDAFEECKTEEEVATLLKKLEDLANNIDEVDDLKDRAAKRLLEIEDS